MGGGGGWGVEGGLRIPSIGTEIELLCLQYTAHKKPQSTC